MIAKSVRQIYKPVFKTLSKVRKGIKAEVDGNRQSLFAKPDAAIVAAFLYCNFAQIFARGMVYLTRLEHFNAAHKLYNPAWSKERNEAIFGQCANENWHGHNFDLFVTVKGKPDKDTGFIMDAKQLSRIIKEYVIEKLDHKNLNIDVDFLSGKMCSTENLVVEIWKQLQPHLPQHVTLHSLKLYETPRIYVEYFGEE